MITPYASNLAHIQGALHVLNMRLHRQVLLWRAGHHPGASAEELAGLYTSDPNIDHLINALYPHPLAPGAQAAHEVLDRLIRQQAETHLARQSSAQAAGIDLRLPRLGLRLGLSTFEMDTLLLGLAAETDRRYERLFGYLNDDLTQRLPSVALAAALFHPECENRLQAPLAFGANGQLRSLQLIHLERETDSRPLVSHGFRLDEFVVAYLLGAPALDSALVDVARLHDTTIELPILNQPVAKQVRQLSQVIARYRDMPMLVNLHGKDLTLLERTAAYLTSSLSPQHLLADAKAFSPTAGVGGMGDSLTATARLVRQGLLLDSALVIVDPGNKLPGRLLQIFTSQPRPCLLLTEAPWQPETAIESPLLHLHIPSPDTTARQRLWRRELDGIPLDPGADLLELADLFSLSAGQISVAAARLRIRTSDRAHLRQVDLVAACREGIRRELGGLAQLVETRHTWDDLILKDQSKSHLLTLEHWARCRHTVLEAWGFGHKTAASAGLVALFNGSSGTGKTLAAGILGRQLGLEVYRIDLSAIVSKYIGETEKNLEKIFEMAQAANAVLFFDEADALFGRRSQVNDAHDRYANVEVSYLLQRMESFPGLAILASNLKQNLDSAFVRRLHMTIEFPFPQAEERQRLWRALIPPEAPLAQDVDLEFLAQQFSLTGGNIRNCVLYAAYSAAGDREPIGMQHLIQAVARELEKLEQPVLPNDFGEYFPLLSGTPRSVQPAARKNGHAKTHV
jgi:hypothetical protein